MINSMSRTGSGNSTVALGWFNKDASREKVGTEEAETNRHRYWDDRITSFIYANHEFYDGPLSDFSVGFINISRESGMGEMWMGDFSSQTDEIRWDTWIPYVKFDKNINDSLSFNAYAKENYSRESGYWSPFSQSSFSSFSGTQQVYAAYDVRVDDYEVLAEWRKIFQNDAELISGVNIDYRRTLGADKSFLGKINSDGSVDPIEFEAPNTSNSVHNQLDDSAFIQTYSAYMQYTKNVDIFNGMSVVSGFRQDEGQVKNEKYSQISPRVGVVTKLTDRHNVKLLWGNALRAPGLKEFGLNIESQTAMANNGESYQVDSIGAETIETLELAHTYSADNIKLTSVIFNNITEDALDGSQVTLGSGSYNTFANNDGDIEAKGYELELKWAPHEGLLMFANHSFSHAESSPANGGLDVRVADVPRRKTNLGLTRRSRKLTSTLLAHYVSDFHVSNSAKRPDGHTTLDMNFIYNYTENVNLEVQVVNAGNSDYKLPWNNQEHNPTDDRYINFSMNIEM